MIWGIHDFRAGEVLFPTFKDSTMPRSLVDSENQCVVQRATTDEDRRYLGDEWQCDHCLPVLKCTSCNPKYRNATLLECVPCESITWHLDGSCLHCEEMRNEH